MTIVNVYEAKSNFSRLLARAEAGEVITLARNGRPIAQLCPMDIVHRPVTLGIFEGQIEMAEDFDSWTAQDEADWFGE